MTVNINDTKNINVSINDIKNINISAEDNNTNITPSVTPKNYVVWIMGQSNAGNASEWPDPSYGEPYDSDDLTTANYIEEYWSTFIERDWKDPFRRVGPAVGVTWWFRQNMPNDTLYIIRINKGASGLFEAVSNSWNKNSGVDPWLSFETTAPVAISLLPDDYEDLGVLWVQGEEDAESETNANNFSSNLDFLISNVEAEIGTKKWVFSKLSLIKTGFYLTINAAYDAKATSDPTKYKTLETEGFTFNPSQPIHYSISSMFDLGSTGIQYLLDLYKGKL